MHRPDPYTLKKNEEGHAIIRALFADGRQLWMKKYSHTDGGVPIDIIPHCFGKRKSAPRIILRMSRNSKTVITLP
jgi:hypothetical protein